MQGGGASATIILTSQYTSFSTTEKDKNGRHLADDTFKCIENVLIVNKISLKFVPKGSNDNMPALDQIMAWRRAKNGLVYWRIYMSLSLNELILWCLITVLYYMSHLISSISDNNLEECSDKIDLFMSVTNINPLCAEFISVMKINPLCANFMVGDNI